MKPNPSLHGMLAATFLASPVAISLKRQSDDMLVEVNDAWCLLLGLNRESVIGKRPTELGIWPDQATRDLALANLLNGQRGPLGQAPHVRTNYVRPDGQALVLQMQGSSMDVGGVPHVVVYTTDVTALQQLNEELARQIEMHKLTENLARVGHWMVEGGEVDPRWSEGLYHVSGLKGEGHLTTTDARARIYPDDMALFVTARQRMDGQIVEYRWLHPEDGVHWMRSRMRRHTRSDGSFVDYGVVQDFTQERLAKEALREQLSKLQLLTSRLPEMVFQFVKQDTGVWKFVFVSDAAQEIFQVSPVEICNNANALLRLILPEDLPRMVESMTWQGKDGLTWAQEFRIRRADGTVRTLFGKALSVLESGGQLVTYGSVSDVTDHRASQASLEESEARFRALTGLSSDWYWEQDENFRFVRLDGAMVKLAGRAGAASLGKTRWETGALNMTEADWAAHRAVLESHAEFRDLELQYIDYKGRPYWMALSGAPIYDSGGKFTGYRGVGRNITERKLAEEKVERLAFFDVLTGLPNRRLLMDRLQQALAASARERSSGALLFIDLDNFKDLSDTQGHDVGDLLLQEVGRRLIACVREVDTVARLGGDEFVVMLQALGSDVALATAQVELVGKKILAGLNQAYLLGNLEHHSTPSVGVTLFEGQKQSVEELLKQADLAMYESKAAGRNTLRFFDPAMQALVAQRTALEADLRIGLKRGELVLYYQPVVDNHSRVVGVEALVRWNHPQRGLVTPGVFISMAEQTGLILPLGEWVLETACMQLAVWAQQPATAKLTIAVNVSARQFRHPDFVPRVLALLEKTQAQPRSLKLELTESLLLTDTQDAVRKMSELRSAGVKFSLDDFGTGYSSLTYLKLLPLEQLKIDQSFVRDVLTDPNDAAIARTILALGHSLGLGVVAEGVETFGQRDFLVNNGCGLFQGYLFGKPVPIAQLQLDAPS
jgi:diguanylate cyclase (GGDEF)-like protein/PAS domain S-box-containing protein